ncbi:flavin reductase family protein [Micromonospora zamorensis]|uniref:flavin reductase family protein n=1 Tax=Micromonospora zamorensis TaxID=709883 RepID=UPI003CF26FFC
MDVINGERPSREVLGTFPSGVVVVTSHDLSEPLGFTCQSFVSLSLNPLLISFTAARDSQTWPRIRAVGSFCVNILADDQREVSMAFAGSRSDRFTAARWWKSGPGGEPALHGACAWITCSLRDEFDGGDHTIVIGAVTGMSIDRRRTPLVFHRGEYASVLAG